MRGFYRAAFFALVALGIFTACHSQPKPTVMSEVDCLRMQLLDSQIQNLKMQAQPLLDEQKAIATRNCTAAGLQLDQCMLDYKTGTVTKKPQPTAAPSIPPAK